MCRITNVMLAYMSFCALESTCEGLLIPKMCDNKLTMSHSSRFMTLIGQSWCVKVLGQGNVRSGFFLFKY